MKIKKLKKRKKLRAAEKAEEARRLVDLAQLLELQLQAIRRQVRQRLEAEFASGALTGPQKLVMSAVVQSRGISLKLLSQQVSLAHSTVSGIVDRLEQQGLLERHTLTSDRRSSQIVASQEVQKLRKSQVPIFAISPLIGALQSASPSERSAVSDGIDTLLRLLTE